MEVGLSTRRNRYALIVDIDETICTQFDVPIPAACETLRALRGVEVHYVTSRPEASRKETDRFHARENLPGWKNLHFCPGWKSSRQHKLECMRHILRLYDVIASIGDADEDEWASREAGIRFVRVDPEDPACAWRKLRDLLG